MNVNYRYKPDEVLYIFDDSDAQTIIYGSEFRDTVLQLKGRLSKVATFIEIGEDDPPAHFSERYEDLVATGADGTPIQPLYLPRHLLGLEARGEPGVLPFVRGAAGSSYNTGQ